MTEIKTEAEKVERLRELLAKATPGPWTYRPGEYDDWGTVRGGATEWGLGHICQARDPRVSEAEHSTHRQNKTDPWEANARFIAEAKSTLPALLSLQDELVEALAGIFGQLDRTTGAPGHHHSVDGIWDADNSSEKAGKPCEWCAHWGRARSALSRARGEAERDRT